uniref:Uncharacterized protein n=1 Tax=viral metagenome TaxID=1070528 RepID=A0A6C0CCU2_9ZZZZ
MTLRLIRYISYLVITSGHINYAWATPANAATQGTHINKRPLMRCNSAPDLTALYNTTSHMSTYTATYMSSNDNKVMPYNKYKSLIFNRYKRNIYLRSKEKYTFAEK